MTLRRSGLGAAVAFAFALAAAPAGAQTAPPASSQPAPAKPATKPAAKPAARAPAPGLVIEPRAVEVLKASSARLASARAMAFTATVTYEYPSLAGPPIAITTRSQVAMQRPDKLFVVTLGDGPPSEVYYDGKAVMAYSPGENLVAVADAPPTVEGALKFLFDASGTYFPFTDVLLDDPYSAWGDNLKLAFYIGRSNTVGGVATDMVAFASAEVFMQAWIGVEDRLPRRIRATFARDPLQLRHQLDLADWQLDVPLPAERFTSAKAAAANRIALGAPVYKVPPPGVKPPPRPKQTVVQPRPAQ